MLLLPSKGISISKNAHNIDLEILCDWIEGSILFCGDNIELSQIDIFDYLHEENIYEEQDFAFEIIESAWSELKRRQELIGKWSPLKVHSDRISSKCRWKDEPAYSFCLLLSLLPLYRNSIEKREPNYNPDYNEQGELFELLTQESLKCQFKDWEVVKTGWSHNQASNLTNIVEDLADRLNERLGNLELWTYGTEKEAGLDILLYRRFPDDRAGKPLFLIQCASGQNWRSKLKTPDIDMWTKYIDFASRPRRGFAMPFAISDKVFLVSSTNVNGLLLDRYRLLSASVYKRNWLLHETKKRMLKWSSAQIDLLPSVEE